MPLVCEDLTKYGVVFIPSNSQQYFDFLADIERRMQERPQGAPPTRPGALSRVSEHDTSNSAILINRAKVAIATVAYYWSYQGPGGRDETASVSPGMQPSVLLPFTIPSMPPFERSRSIRAYWNTIFPGSKRLITERDGILGDNTDVRPPNPDEMSTGWGGASAAAAIVIEARR